jgi:BMFP domain-containing protein YqiC
MPREASLFEDVLKLGESLLTALLDTKGDLKELVVEKAEVFASRFDLVRREEMEGLQAMIAKARAEQEKLKARLDRLAPPTASKKASTASKKTKKDSLKKKNTRPELLLSVKHGNRRKRVKK